ncbi:MAG TPA: hypothetical protein VFG76_03530 [Candidatus Polarisedimenticolia bacterium]|nr:hypothetical protein [Candidatus Polarisedimenticolia bacterium]
MRIMLSEKRSWVAVGALAMICVFGFLGLRAGDELSATLAPPTTSPNPPLNVAESNKDSDGNIKVHEQGTVRVTGTVDVGNSPKVLDVNVTNEPLEVTGNVAVKTGTVHFYHREVYPFDEDVELEIDIHEYSRARVQITVNGSGTVDFLYATDGGVHGEFSEDSGGFGATLLLPEVAGTELRLFLSDPDGEQVFVNVFGTY